jgi:hypothetical protein
MIATVLYMNLVIQPDVCRAVMLLAGKGQAEEVAALTRRPRRRRSTLLAMVVLLHGVPGHSRSALQARNATIDGSYGEGGGQVLAPARRSHITGSRCTLQHLLRAQAGLAGSAPDAPVRCGDLWRQMRVMRLPRSRRVPPAHPPQAGEYA